MVQTVTKLEYLTTDGRKFDKLEDAERHERLGPIAIYIAASTNTSLSERMAQEIAEALLKNFDMSPKASYRGTPVRDL